MTEGQEERKGYNPLLKNYPDSVKINRVSIGAETLYIRLLARSDDYADYDADPRLMLAGLFGKRWKNREVSEVKIKTWLAELEAENLVEKYQVDGEIYLHLIDCFKTLRSDVKRDVRYPKYSPELVINKGLPEHGTDTERPRPPNQTRLDQTRLDNICTELFDKFWKAYPRKEAKNRAREWFKKNQPAEEDVQKMIYLIRKQSCRGGRLERKLREHMKYIPLPTTWLNDGDYQDAPTEADVTEQKAASEQQALEKKRREVRKEYWNYYAEKEFEELQVMRKDKNHLTRWWLIDEVMEFEAKRYDMPTG